MMKRVIDDARSVIRTSFQSHVEAVNCHHNYVQREHHFGADVYVTRKGAVINAVMQAQRELVDVMHTRSGKSFA